MTGFLLVIHELMSGWPGAAFYRIEQSFSAERALLYLAMAIAGCAWIIYTSDETRKRPWSRPALPLVLALALLGIALTLIVSYHADYPPGLPRC